MNFRSVASVILAVTLLFAFQLTCPPQAVASPAKTLKPPSVPKASSQDEWETVVRNARKEGKVVIYGSVIGDTKQAWTKAVKDKYGLNLEFMQGRGSEIAQKMLAERRAGLNFYDVGIGGLTSYFGILKPGKVVGSIDSLVILDEVKNPANWRIKRVPYLDKEKTVMPLAALASYYVGVNSTMVKEGEITSYDDLLNPRWKGKIVLNDPTLSGAGNEWFNFMMVQNYGSERGAEYFRKLAAQDLAIMRDERLQIEAVARGKFPVALGMKRTLLDDFIKAGAPIKALKLTGKAALSSGSLNLYVSDLPANPNAQKVFVNFVLGREAQEILMKTSGYASERSDVSTAGLDPSLVPGPKDEVLGEEYDLMKTANMKVAAELFRNILK